jgi:Flp pilus assembly protein TadB
MIALVSLAAVWAWFLIPQAVRRRREGRPGSSVVSFRQQLSTLERATPGHSLRLSTSGPVPVVRSVPPARRSQIQRRRDILLGLMAATGVTFLLAVAMGGVATYLFVLCGGALGAYVYALVQLRKRAEERQHKVRVLAPRATPAPAFTLRRAAN